MILFFSIGGVSIPVFYCVIGFIGFATGYWAVFISVASELFGTNIRATVTTTAPNFVRASTILISFLLDGLILLTNDKILATQITGGIILLISFVALYFLEETYGKELDYNEVS